MAPRKLLLRNDVIGPSFSLCKLSGYGQLALDLWLGELSRRLDFYKPFAAIRHFDEEVGDDVAALLAVTSSSVDGRAIEQFDLDVILQLLPDVPDRKGLLLDVENLGTSHKCCGRGSFKLALAADRPALLWTGHQ